MKMMQRRQHTFRSRCAAIALLVAFAGHVAIGADATESLRELPEFTHANQTDWINSEPLVVADLKGRVVLVDVWTFGCWNCYRSFPWLRAVEHRFGSEGLTVIGVHSPEFPHEGVRASVVKKVAQFELHHPVMIDNDLSYWRALGNQYWPTFYLVDKRGQIRSVFIGETHVGDRRALDIEERIKTLLAEPTF